MAQLLSWAVSGASQRVVAGGSLASLNLRVCGGSGSRTRDPDPVRGREAGMDTNDLTSVHMGAVS